MKTTYQNKEDISLGHYLVSDIDAWHGGIHAGGAIRSIADGDIVAYKIASEYIEEIKSTDNGDVTTSYSDSFVLVKHKYSYVVKENAKDNNKEFIFYSLYVHLSIKEQLLNTQPTPAFLHWSTIISSDETLKPQMKILSGINLRASPNGNCLGIIPKGCDVIVLPKSDKAHWYEVVVSKLLKESKKDNCIIVEIVKKQIKGCYFNKEIASQYDLVYINTYSGFGNYSNPLKPFLGFVSKVPYRAKQLEHLNLKNNSTEDSVSSTITGAILFESNNPNGAQKGIIPAGTTVIVLEKNCSDWFKVRTNELYLLAEDFELKTVYKRETSKEGFVGWCRNTNGQFDNYVELEYDKVVELEKPIQVSVGDLLGYASKYEAGSAFASRYVATHLEVFSNDNVPAFLEDMKKLITDKNKTIELKDVKNDFKTESFTHISVKKIVHISDDKKDEPKDDRIKPEKLKLSEDGKLFIKAWESEQLDGYWDSEGYLTIGIGTLLYDKETFEKIRRKDKSQIVNCKEVTRRVAEAYIQADSKGDNKVKITTEKSTIDFNNRVGEFEDAVRALDINFYQWEFDAIVSLFFNTGSGVKAPSLRKHLKNGNYTDAGKQLNDITNNDTPGLVYRRAAEMDMFLNGNESYVSFKNNNNIERDLLVGKLNGIRRELKIKEFKNID